MSAFKDACKEAAKQNNFSFEAIKDIPAYVINIAEEEFKYNKVKAYLEKLGFSKVYRHIAVDARKNTPTDLLLSYGIKNTEKYKSPGEIGCALSHLEVYRKFLATDEKYCLVFEDDALPHTRFHELIKTVEGLSMDSFDILNLGGWFWSYDKNRDLHAVRETVETKNFLNNPHSFETHAMLITRKFANKAISNYHKQENSPRCLAFDNYIAETKYFDTCLLTFPPFDSENIDIIRLRDANNCGLFFQENTYTSHIQDPKSSANGFKEVSHKDCGGKWIVADLEEEYRFDDFVFYGDTHLKDPFVMPETGMLVLDDAYVSVDGYTHTADGCGVMSLYWYGDRKSRSLNKWKSVLNQHKLGSFNIENAQRYSGTGLNLCASFSNLNPGHFQMDVLGMISLVKKLNILDINSFDWICIPPIVMHIKDKIIDTLGIQPSKIVYMDKSVVCKFDKLYTPSLNGCGARYRRGAFDYINSLFKTDHSGDPDKLLYVSREGHGRDIANLEEIEAYLDFLGFQKINSKKLENYVELFGRAKVVIGAHGAGLANCMFCSKKATLIELVPKFHQHPYYISLADSVGMKYTGIICEQSTFKDDRVTMTVNGQKYIDVNIDLLKKAITAVIN